MGGFKELAEQPLALAINSEKGDGCTYITSISSRVAR
jgi:hypothetical protein